MSNPPPRPAAELLLPLIRALCFALEAQTQSFVARLARPLMGLIGRRIIDIGQRFGRYVARIEAGRPFPRRRTATASTAASRSRRKPDPLPRRTGWLERALPNIVPLRAQFCTILATPEMAAVMQAAPEQMGRVLRPLCRMFGVRPPPVIALPPRRKRAPKPPPPPMPSWPHDPRPRTRLGFYVGPPPMLPLLAQPSRPPPRKKPA